LNRSKDKAKKGGVKKSKELYLSTVNQPNVDCKTPVKKKSALTVKIQSAPTEIRMIQKS